MKKIKIPCFKGIRVGLMLLMCTFVSNVYSQTTIGNIGPVLNDDSILDFIQVYHGYKKRLPWHANEIKHYVYRDHKGKPEWLFNGFLFLEIYGDFNGKMYDYGAEQPGKLAPGKAEWENLICKNFEETRGPDGLEQVLDSLAKKGFYPPVKRKVVFSIPNPIYGVKNWGFIEHKALDFNFVEDRIAAINWYMDRVIDEWNKKKYKHLDFAGFYWIHEQIDFDNQDDIMLKSVNRILHSKNHKSYWLPYYTASGFDQWKDLGFNYAYQQPNYFFHAGANTTAITKTIENTQKLNMGIMMEFDARVLSQPKPYAQMFWDYVDAFEKGGVWKTQPVNYYDGGDGWYRLSISKDKEAKAMYRALSDIIVRRNQMLIKR